MINWLFDHAIINVKRLHETFNTGRLDCSTSTSEECHVMRDLRLASIYPPPLLGFVIGVGRGNPQQGFDAICCTLVLHYKILR